MSRDSIASSYSYGASSHRSSGYGDHSGSRSSRSSSSSSYGDYGSGSSSRRTRSGDSSPSVTPPAPSTRPTPPSSYEPTTRPSRSSSGSSSSGYPAYPSTRPTPPSVGPSRGGTSIRPGSTVVTSRGTVVHRDEYGNITYPSRSQVIDVHDSRSGKSYVVDHGDGIREIHNYATGKVTYQRTPASQDSRYVAPSYVQPVYYERRSIDRTSIILNDYNQYLFDTALGVLADPVFYNGYRWQPPMFAPILYTPGLEMYPLDDYSRTQDARTPVSELAGAGFYTVEFQQGGIYNAFDLLQQGRTPTDRANLADYTGIPYDEIRKAVGQADLMRVNGIGPTNSRLLVDAGITSMQDLARYSWDPQTLCDQLRYSSFWDGRRSPSLSQVESWIQQARNLPVAIYDDGQ